jgi:uncharacterized damage-inducible protein DinB
MSLKSQFKAQFAFHFDTTRRLMDKAALLTDTDYRENPGYSRGSIHDTLYHVLRADQGWRTSLESGRQAPPPPPEGFPDLAALRAGFDLEQAAWTRLEAGLDDATLSADITLTRMNGETLIMPRWRVMQHVLMHGMQHHADLAHMLTTKGQSPGDIDFLFFH